MRQEEGRKTPTHKHRLAKKMLIFRHHTECSSKIRSRVSSPDFRLDFDDPDPISTCDRPDPLSKGNRVSSPVEIR